MAGFINTALQKALLYETDPATSVAILYRLIVTQGRRRSELSLAYTSLDRAYKLLNENNFSDKELLTAWINNIHSYLLMKQSRLQEAITTQEAGFYLLEGLTGISSPAMKDEVAFTKAVLAENLSTLSSLSGDRKQMKAWYAIESRLTKKWSGLLAVSSAEWQSFHYQNLELKKALEKTQNGLVQSKESFHYVLECFFTISAADICYRLGHTADALDYFQRALLLQEQIGYDYASPHTLQICLVKIKIRLNRIEEALTYLEEQENISPPASATAQLDNCLVKANGYTLSGCYAQAEEQINKAIELAVMQGDCGSLVKVTTGAATVCRLMNRRQDAVDTYYQALEISTTIIDGIAYQPDTADLAEIYLGLYECGEKKSSYLDLCVSNLSLSLKHTADSWWSLQRVLIAIAALPVKERKEYLQKNKPVINTIRKAARQRNDCREYLAALTIAPGKPIIL